MKLHLLIVFVLLSTALLVGQTFRGTILGSVTDPSGAFVAGATVKVRNVATGIERTTVTSGDGSYNVPELPIGTYSVTITQTGFQTAVTNNVEVDVATERRVDAQLKTGQVTQPSPKLFIDQNSTPHPNCTRRLNRHAVRFNER